MPTAAVLVDGKAALFRKTVGVSGCLSRPSMVLKAGRILGEQLSFGYVGRPRKLGSNVSKGWYSHGSCCEIILLYAVNVYCSHW